MDAARHFTVVPSKWNCRESALEGAWAWAASPTPVILYDSVIPYPDLISCGLPLCSVPANTHRDICHL